MPDVSARCRAITRNAASSIEARYYDFAGAAWRKHFGGFDGRFLRAQVGLLKPRQGSAGEGIAAVFSAIKSEAVGRGFAAALDWSVAHKAHRVSSDFSQPRPSAYSDLLAGYENQS